MQTPEPEQSPFKDVMSKYKKGLQVSQAEVQTGKPSRQANKFNREQAKYKIQARSRKKKKNKNREQNTRRAGRLTHWNTQTKCTS